MEKQGWSYPGPVVPAEGRNLNKAWVEEMKKPESRGKIGSWSQADAAGVLKQSRWPMQKRLREAARSTAGAAMIDEGLLGHAKGALTGGGKWSVGSKIGVGIAGLATVGIIGNSLRKNRNQELSAREELEVIRLATAIHPASILNKATHAYDPSVIAGVHPDSIIRNRYIKGLTWRVKPTAPKRAVARDEVHPNSILNQQPDSYDSSEMPGVHPDSILRNRWTRLSARESLDSIISLSAV